MGREVWYVLDLHTNEILGVFDNEEEAESWVEASAVTRQHPIVAALGKWFSWHLQD